MNHKGCSSGVPSNTWKRAINIRENLGHDSLHSVFSFDERFFRPARLTTRVLHGLLGCHCRSRSDYSCLQRCRLVTTLRSIFEEDPTSQHDTKSLRSLSKLILISAPCNSECGIRIDRHQRTYQINIGVRVL